MGKVYVLGGAQTDFERNWSKEGKGMLALLKESVLDGLAGAGLSLDDVKKLNKENRIGCFVGNFIGELFVDQGHLGALLTMIDPAFEGVPSARYEAACSSSSVAIDAAASKVLCGTYDVAIVVGWELMKTVDSRMGGSILGRAAFYEQEGRDIEFPFPKLFGRLADALLEKYNLNEKLFMESLSCISVKNYTNAKRNPLSQTRKWFMDFRQANNRGTDTNPFVGGRIAVSDCSQVTDGAAVVVLASESFVSSRGIKECPHIKGWGHRVAPMLFDRKLERSRDSSHVLPWTQQAILDAYNRSGLTVDDIDVFETHDCFTSSEYAAVSAFGIAAPGEEYRAILEGYTSFGGRKPINPSGGLIGCGHPVGASGARMLLDIYKQVSNTAGSYQVKSVVNGMMLNIGGSATTNYAFIVGK